MKDPAALDAKLEEVLKQIDRCAPIANALTKDVVMKVGTEPLSSVLDFAADKFAEARRSPEAAEGLRAFAEKRRRNGCRNDRHERHALQSTCRCVPATDYPRTARRALPRAPPPRAG